MSEVTQEMLEVGAEIWWQTRDQPLYPRLEAAYRAMRALEPDPPAIFDTKIPASSDYAGEFYPNTPSPPQTRVPGASEDPG